MSLVKGSLALTAVVALAAGSAQAAPLLLEDANSSTTIDPASQAGQFDWFVDGTDYLHQQWFWFRIGQTAEESIDTIPISAGPLLIDTNPLDDARPDTLSVQYTLAGALQIDVTFILRGGAAGTNSSDVAELITLRNISGTALPLSFFQYADFDLPGNDVVQFLTNNNVVQTDGLITMQETIINPPSTLFEANLFAATLIALNDAFATNLNGVAAAGPGDVTWAFQWDFLLGAGDSVLISKDKQLVPTPGALAALLGVGGLALVRRRRA